MKIENYNVSLASSREYQEKDVCKTNFHMEWLTVFNQKLFEQGNADRFNSEGFRRDQISMYKEKLLERLGEMQNERYAYMTGISESFFNNNDKVKNPVLDLILEKLLSMDIIGIKSSDILYTYQNINIENIRNAPQTTTFDVKVRFYEERLFKHQESENTTFLSEGSVRTQDGKEINFAMNMDTQRAFIYEEKCEYMEEGVYKFIDPLIVNYDGLATELSDFTFNFDLNSDNETEELFGLKPGSGFLAFDMNEDGKINDGTELFGTKSGDGFFDLKQYDTDNNDWIDENDDIYDHLAVWNRNEKGEDSLHSIKEKGVGAIYLKSEETPFDLRNKENRLLAKVEKTGIALKDDETPVSVQQINYTA